MTTRPHYPWKVDPGTAGTATSSSAAVTRPAVPRLAKQPASTPGQLPLLFPVDDEEESHEKAALAGAAENGSTRTSYRRGC